MTQLMYFFIFQKMMEDALEKQRANIAQKQVAAGREFKVTVFQFDCSC